MIILIILLFSFIQIFNLNLLEIVNSLPPKKLSWQIGH